MNDTFIITAPIIITLLALLIKLFQWLWNITMPDVFETKKITYWQAFIVLFIAGILLGGVSADWGVDQFENELEVSTNSVMHGPNSTMPSRLETQTN